MFCVGFSVWFNLKIFSMNRAACVSVKRMVRIFRRFYKNTNQKCFFAGLSMYARDMRFMLTVLHEKVPKRNSDFRINEVGHYICPNNCGREYKHTATLYQHLKYDCGKQKQFLCLECNRPFARKTHLKVHVYNVHRKLLKWYCILFKFVFVENIYLFWSKK